eukprot:TRINITY_DN10579_c0_g1_i1.p1 TRINITY_DN10579_c0_g1~~TRINITY_DN10579_c0_g1_i1.p1  ORF type:complete len:107 (+),score=26.85 TRINITY_DN10579_c0_g1_i1:31-321(+)
MSTPQRVVRPLVPAPETGNNSDASRRIANLSPEERQALQQRIMARREAKQPTATPTPSQGTTPVSNRSGGLAPATVPQSSTPNSRTIPAPNSTHSN